VHSDNWKIDACPVNGPAIAATGRRVAVAWFTAANDTARVKLAFSSAARASGFPQMAVRGSDVFFAWTVPGAKSAVRVARAQLSDFK
jgi:hypothetical protein